MSIREQMYQAQEHIQNKQYAEARELLMGVDHPKAREWLEKLDAMASTPAPPQNNAQQKGRYIPQNWRPGYVPINPNYIVYAISVPVAILTFFMRRALRARDLVDDIIPNVVVHSIALACLMLVMCTVPYAINWGRLARPRWGVYTFLVAVVTLLVIPVAVLLFLQFIEANQFIPAMLTMVALATATGIGIALPAATMTLQDGAYKKWDTDNVKPVLYHQYPWDTAQIGILGFVIVCIIGAFIIYAVEQPFKTFTNDELSLRYPSAWSGLDCPYNDDRPNCVMYIRRPYADKTFNHHDIFLLKYPRESLLTAVDAEAYWHDGLRERHPNKGVVEVQDITIDGVPARYVDTIEPHRYACTYRERTIFIVYKESAYHIRARSCDTDWAALEPLMMNVVRGLDLH